MRTFEVNENLTSGTPAKILHTDSRPQDCKNRNQEKTILPHRPQKTNKKQRLNVFLEIC